MLPPKPWNKPKHWSVLMSENPSRWTCGIVCSVSSFDAHVISSEISKKLSPAKYNHDKLKTMLAAKSQLNTIVKEEYNCAKRSIQVADVCLTSDGYWTKLSAFVNPLILSTLVHKQNCSSYGLVTDGLYILTASSRIPYTIDYG